MADKKIIATRGYRVCKMRIEIGDEIPEHVLKIHPKIREYEDGKGKESTK